MRRGRLGIRQSLFSVLLALVIVMTSLFLLLVFFTVNSQVERTSLAEMARSRDNFQTLERQQQDQLLRQTALLSELPSLKALMTSDDQPTIADAGKAFWQTSGSDFFALTRPDGTLLAVYSNGRPIAREDCSPALAQSRDTPYRPTLLYISGRLFEVASEPISFSSGEQRRLLGFISNGYELNDHLVEMIGRSPTGHVIFATSNRVIASTLNAAQLQDLTPTILGSLTRFSHTHSLALGREGYFVTSFLLQEPSKTMPSVYLVLLESDKEKTALLRELNGGVMAIGALLLLIGSGMAMVLAGTVTRPLEALLRSTRQMGRGEAIAAVPSTGLLEVRELGEAFEKMHDQILFSQARLIETERQATIGLMASSISHDLRHYLSPIYANAEFLSSSTLSVQEREELLAEIIEAATGMNELLKAILTFSRTGIAVQLAPDSITVAVRSALVMIQSHPDANGVSIEATGLEELAGCIDGKELQRAVYNLLLNACQAARDSSSPPSVRVMVQQAVDRQGKVFAAIRIRDNGKGVCDTIAPRLFEPFVSIGKESGTGLGLALVKRIAEAHGGSAGMRRLEEEVGVWQTEFFLLIPVESTADCAVPGDATLGVIS